MYITQVDSPVGRLTLAARDGCLTGLWLEGQKYFMAGADPETENAPDAAPFPQARAWLAAYFAGQDADASALPLAPRGTDFQRRVWQALREIPRGQTRTYGQLSAVLHSSARAVGGAVGHNPISILIPCHRVLGAAGRLTGYAGGADRKALLLRLEGAAFRE